MSVSIGELVRVTGRQVAARARARCDLRQRRRRGACPGLQSTYFSPISDCGRIVQVAFGVKRREARSR